MQVNVHEAKTQLSRLPELVEESETIVIARHGRPVAELVPARQTGFPFGIARAEPLVAPGMRGGSQCLKKKPRTGSKAGEASH